MLDESRLIPLSDLQRHCDMFKVLSHPVRLRIVDILSRGGFPVHRIAELCHLRPHQTCEHLRMMQSLGALASLRRGREVHYSIEMKALHALVRSVRRNSNANAQV